VIQHQTRPIHALLSAIAILATGPALASAQMTDMASAGAADATRTPHLYDARDFGVDPAEVTFSAHIAPILQRSCENCHRPNGAGPMALVEYNQVRRYASLIREKTAIRDRMGTMPPWYVEKDIGIQHFKNDNSLSDLDLALIQAWADNGAPEGDPADLPEPLEWGDGSEWTIRPDLVVETEPMVVEGDAPDWWGEIASVPVPLEEDRYVRAVEIREINDVPMNGTGRSTVGGKYVVHHMIWRTRLDRDVTSWPVHEVGRNPDVFDDGAGRLLKAGSSIESESIHLHSNGLTTTATLQIGFEFFPEGYEPEYQGTITSLGNGSDIDIRPGEAGQELHAYTVVTRPTKIISFEPHLHAPGERMCLEAIWGFKSETLACVGYDHNWVRTYVFEDDYQPLIPPGAILHITGYMNNSETNANVPDARNWQGSGNRSLANMFIDLGERVFMSEEQFIDEIHERVEKLGLTKNDYLIGCPLCLAVVETPGANPLIGPPTTPPGGGN
jgi:hypothetical protein